jgi:hypothetical protein
MAGHIGATPAQRARYSTLRGEFKCTPQSDLLNRGYGREQLKFVRASGPVGSAVLIFGMMLIRSDLSDNPRLRRLQLRKLVMQHFRKARASRKRKYPTDSVNKQQSGKIGRHCLEAAAAAFHAKSLLADDGSPGALEDRDIFAVTVRGLVAMVSVAMRPDLGGPNGRRKLFCLAKNLDTRSDLRWAPSGISARAAGLTANVKVDANPSPYTNGYPVDYILYGIRLAVTAHDGCCEGGKRGCGDFCHPWMADLAVRGGMPSCWWAPTWCICTCDQFYRFRGRLQLDRCSCSRGWWWVPFSDAKEL